MSKAGLKHLHTDKKLSPWIKKIGPLDLTPRQLDPFVALSRAIVYQQLSGKAAATILRRFQELFSPEPGAHPTPRQVMKTPVEKLRSVGLSGQKAGYILDLAQRSHAGLIPTLTDCEKLTDAEIIELLTATKGVGRWTVEMFLIFNLGRPDVLPVHDLGIRKGYQVAFGKRAMPTPKALDKLGLPWAPHRTLAARYLWQIADWHKTQNK